MITWTSFIYFGVASIVLWLTGATIACWRKRTGAGLFLCGTLLFGLFIILFWHTLGRPPMRTMGETRLWYSCCIAAIGLVLHLRWHDRFLLPFAAVLASVFTLINLLHPEIHSTTLMPALQSAWFIPHVVIYMVAYALMAAGLLFGIATLGGRTPWFEKADRLTRIGAALLILGMLMGAVWAKQAWGNYWAWDAKECWAAVTWLLYLAYVHFRVRWPLRLKTAVVLLFAAFLALQITWYGINYLPAAKKSLHTYTQIRE
ncbi:MAG: cytochrome c biogenesis protein CcsA [Alistipes sp.]